MNPYLLHGKLTAKQGQRATLSNILIQASNLVRKSNGCQLYAVGLDKNDAHAVFVTEIWASKEDHDASLKDEAVRELIKKAMPLLDGAPTKGQELELIGGTAN